MVGTTPNIGMLGKIMKDQDSNSGPPIFSQVLYHLSYLVPVSEMSYRIERMNTNLYKGIWRQKTINIGETCTAFSEKQEVFILCRYNN